VHSDQTVSAETPLENFASGVFVKIAEEEIMNRKQYIAISISIFLIIMIVLIFFEQFLLDILSSNLILKRLILSLLQPAPLTAILTLIFGLCIAYPEFLKIKKKVEVEYIIEKVKETEALVYKYIPMFLKSSYLLSRRIEKILRVENEEYSALNFDFVAEKNWSMTFSYQMNTLLYCFACHFAWMKIVNDEIFCSHYIKKEERNTLNNCMMECMNAISNHYKKNDLPIPLDENDKDIQVFKNYQDIIGSMVFNNTDKKIISFVEFEKIIKKDENRAYIKPLQDLLINIKPGEYRWKRLTHFLRTLNILLNILSSTQDILKSRLLKLEISNFKISKEEVSDLGIQYKIDYETLHGTVTHTTKCPYDEVDIDMATSALNSLDK